MAWQPKGNCYAFCESSILAHAPQTSGVFGLYNSEYQLYIGESANVRAALLQHLSEIERQPSRFQPTDFAFEACAPERRVDAARRLVEEYQPLRQAEWPPTDLWEFALDGKGPLDYEFGSAAEQQWRGDMPASAASEIASETERRFYFAQGQFAVLVAMFALSLGVIFFLGILTGESLHKKATAGYKSPLVSFTAGPRLPEPAATRSAVVEPVPLRDAALQAAEAVSETAVKPVVKTDNSQGDGVNGALPAGPKYAVSARLTPTVKANRDAPPAVDAEFHAADGVTPNRERGASWTVQLAANREKALTEKQVVELKAGGYEAYIVETEREGQTWYRLRVGRFATRAEADALREVLEARQGYRTPFITRE
ncbi:MAG TPA: SPOR domain-containing protein [Verrucomicrobiae bacterium]|nr:SPOR domain-containing protein [Verrucomicrobiae bacterium]